MKHAGPEALDRLEPLLAQLRTLPGLKEKGRGVFYLAGRAAFHVHEDPAGLFADVRPRGAADFQRIRVDLPEGAREAVRRLRGDP